LSEKISLDEIFTKLMKEDLESGKKMIENQLYLILKALFFFEKHDLLEEFKKSLTDGGRKYIEQNLKLAKLMGMRF
jgi:hypothetical protein